MRFLLFGLLFLSAVYFSESYSIAKRDAKEELMKKVEDLKLTVDGELAKLKAKGKMALAGGLQNIEKLIKDAETTIKTAEPTTEIGKALLLTAEMLIKKIEMSIQTELQKLAGSFYAEESKDELVKQVNNLKKVVADEIAKLKAAGKTALAEGFVTAEKVLLDVEKQLETLQPGTAMGLNLMGSLKTILKSLETKIEEEIKKLSAGLVKRDAQADLLKTITDLLAKAHTAVATLEKEGKTALVAGLKKSVTFLMDVEKQLMTLKPTTELGKALLEGLEQLVKQGEAALEADLKKAEGGF